MPKHKSNWSHVLQRFALVGLCMMLCGCEVGSYLVYALNGPKKENVLAEYAGLNNAHFAVLVSADADTLYQSPEAPAAICTAVSRELAKNVPGAIAMSPRKMVAFQEENPYWTTIPYNRLLEKLEVEKLVIIDIVQYQIHDKGNASIFRGTAIANVSVAKASESSSLSYSKVVKATYPVGSAIGMINAETDEQSFRLALLHNLTITIGHLFYDYTVIHE